LQKSGRPACPPQTLHNDGMYCQGCAYVKGLCSMCGKQIIDVSKYKQTVA
jgi:hypothetical protein